VQTLLVYLAQTLTASAPLCLAALGGVISERSGVATISLEAYLLGGAFAAAAVALATSSLPLALLGAVALGAALAGVFAWSTISLRANAIVAGVAVNLLAAAGTRVALKVLYDSAANSPALPIGRASSASIGAAALSEALRAPAVLLTPLVAWALHVTLRDTVFGMRVTACGENPDAARSLGVSVPRVRAAALVLGGAVAALGGAQLALFQHEFVAYMSGGRGFLALAAVILGRWRPLRAVGWAVGIGALQALEATLSSRAGVPHALLQAMPFALTLLAVAGPWGRARAPAALG
jgi:general nucleoside transport system permease protein